jgi:hypothetical protein
MQQLIVTSDLAATKLEHLDEAAAQLVVQQDTSLKNQATILLQSTTLEQSLGEVYGARFLLRSIRCCAA